MGKKFILHILISIFLFLILPLFSRVRAELVAGSSAVIYYTKSENIASDSAQKLLVKKRAIRNYILKYQAPLASEVDAFINACSQYELDCYLLPAISGVESSFGLYISPGSNNAFGWGRGIIPFKSFAEGIMTVGKGLKENYIDKGAVTVEQIGRIYCEGDTWAGKVSYFMNQLEKEEKNLLLLNANPVSL